MCIILWYVYVKVPLYMHTNTIATETQFQITEIANYLIRLLSLYKILVTT